MADITKLPILGFYRIGGTETAPVVSLASSSVAGSTALVFDADITDEAGAQISKAMHLGFNVGGKVLICYIAANGWSSKRACTITGRACDIGGLDITTSNTALDFDLPAGTPVYGAITAFAPTMLLSALQGDIATGKNTFKVGDATDADIFIYAKNADANPPYLKYDASSNAWFYANDGASENPMGGSGALTGGDGIAITEGDIDIDMTDTVIFKNARTGNEIRVPVTAVADGKLDKTFMPTYVENLIDSGTSVAEIDQVCDGVSANVTAANLGTLTAGVASNADALHTHQSIDAIDGTISSGTTYYSAQSLAEKNFLGTQTDPLKLKEITVKYSGTYTIAYEMQKADVSVSSNTRIYKNGSTFGTLHTTGGGGSAGAWDPFSENLAFSAGDLIQVYGWMTSSHADTNYPPGIRNLKMTYVILPSIAQYESTVTLD